MALARPLHRSLSILRVDCATAITSPRPLLKLGQNPAAKVLDPKPRVRCRRCGARGQAVVSVKWHREGGGAGAASPSV